MNARRRLWAPRVPGTVLVALVEVEGGIAPYAVVDLGRTRVQLMAPSGACRTFLRDRVVLDDLPVARWNDAVRVAGARASVDLDEGLLGGPDGLGLLGVLQRAGAPVPTAEDLRARRERRRAAADEGERALGFKVV